MGPDRHEVSDGGFPMPSAVVLERSSTFIADELQQLYRAVGWVAYRQPRIAVTRAVSVGAEVAAYQPRPTVRVLLDPAGQPFCLYFDG